jgi:predicted phage tail protein
MSILTWQAVPVQFYVTGYKVKGMLNGGMQQTLGETAETTFTLANLATGNWQFNVSAVNMAGEGPQSAAVQGPVIPPAPGGLTLTVTV